MRELFINLILGFGAIFFFGKFAFWIYLMFLDRKIKKLNDELIDIPAKYHMENVGRGITAGGAEPIINGLKRGVEAKLKKIENSRKLFLERATFFSAFV